MVQGVGFRPLVYRLAHKSGVRGTVRNVGGYVEILAQGSGEEIAAFIQAIKAAKGRGCEILKLEAEDDAAYSEYSEFVIIGSKESDEVSVIPPDLPLCPECAEELDMPVNRRFQNPFISCMSCGPRYTIIEALPYDRQSTVMKDFKMCEACQKEYTEPFNRRFHAQTISCNDCGPYLILKERARSDAGIEAASFINQEAFDRAANILIQGGILAVKGIGGYHFVCSPFLEETVKRLRLLKGREEKPFAVMFPSIGSAEGFCMASEEERALLSSVARPIVLLLQKSNTMAPSTNKASLYCGAFLPYTPLQLMLTKKCGPLIMTSANLSDRPIIREDKEILEFKAPGLSGILFNTRRILRSVDDSVAKVIDKKPQLIRRSRGYVPYPVFLPMDLPSGGAIFAAGGDLKAAYCLYERGKAVVSQYFGDLEEASVMQEYKNSYADLTKLLHIRPELAVCDMHPNYHSVRFARELGLPVLPVQHHHAHIASVMAEHALDGRVIGVAFDGTGYGTDGSIWGSEFLICEGAGFIRAAHLSYQRILGGDQSARDAKKTASCYLLQCGLGEYTKDERKSVIQAALDKRINTVLTSSMGRLFDAVTSILGLAQENCFEGECATLLEREAYLAASKQIKPEKLVFSISEKNEIIEIDIRPVLEKLCRLRDKKTAGALALGFHYAIAEAVCEVCERLRSRYQCNTAALCGGVFQNTVLTEYTLHLLREKGFEVYLNMAVPPNDGSISLGQTYIGMQRFH